MRKIFPFDDIIMMYTCIIKSLFVSNISEQDDNYRINSLPPGPHKCVCELYQNWFSEILIKTQNFSFTKMYLKISSAKWQPFCPGGDELDTSTQADFWDFFGQIRLQLNSSLLQIMDWRQTGKAEKMLPYCIFNPMEHTQNNFICNSNNFIQENHWKMSLGKQWPFCSGRVRN